MGGSLLVVGSVAFDSGRFIAHFIFELPGSLIDFIGSFLKW